MKQRRGTDRKKLCASANARQRAVLTGPRGHDFWLWTQTQ